MKPSANVWNKFALGIENYDDLFCWTSCGCFSWWNQRNYFLIIGIKNFWGNICPPCLTWFYACEVHALGMRILFLNKIMFTRSAWGCHVQCFYLPNWNDVIRLDIPVVVTSKHVGFLKPQRASHSADRHNSGSWRMNVQELAIHIHHAKNRLTSLSH